MRRIRVDVPARRVMYGASALLFPAAAVALITLLEAPPGKRMYGLVIGTVVLAISVGTAGWVYAHYRVPDSFRLSFSLSVPKVAFAVRLVGLAALLAGMRRNTRSAWEADLDGDPESGQIPTRTQKALLVAGFFKSALKYRLHDWFGWAWLPVDWMLATKSRRDGFRTSIVGIHAIYIADANGLHALFTLGLGWLAVTYAFVTGTTTWLGKRRGIELASDDDPPQG